MGSTEVISSNEVRTKREIDPDYYRRYNRLARVYRNRPFLMHYLKYFIRNRGQSREKRQVGTNYYYNNAAALVPTRTSVVGNAYGGYNQNRKYYNNNQYDTLNLGPSTNIKQANPYVRYQQVQVRKTNTNVRRQGGPSRTRRTTTRQPYRKKPFKPLLALF